MSTPNEDRQRETDRQFGLHERRTMDRARFGCAGEAAAHDASAHDQCACADCRLMFPGGSLRVYPHGNICENCHEERQDNGMAREAFGESPRQIRSPRPVTVQVRRMDPRMLGTPEERAAYADEMIERERQAERANIAAATADEVFSEGRVHRNTRPQRHE